MPPLEIPYVTFKEWKLAYKECKKQASVKVKDRYDQFLDELRYIYKTTLKGKTEMKFSDLINFFDRVIDVSDSYINDKKNWSMFYKANREKAVKKLINKSSEIKQDLDQQIKDAPKEVNSFYKAAGAAVGGITGFFLGGPAGATAGAAAGAAAIGGLTGTKPDINSMVKVKNVSAKCIVSIVLDIPYVALNVTSIRCYILVEGKGNLSTLNEKFDFIHYEFENKKFYEDKDYAKRTLNKTAVIPINLPSKIGAVKIAIYLSPNDFVSKQAIKGVSIDRENIYINHELLPSSEL